MDVVLLSRLQFAVAVFFHFIFVPLTLGLSVLIAIMETRYVRTGDETYKRMAKFWGRLFIINFTLGVVTGITLVFQFGTNWARYSEYVGDIFGSLLAIEATVAFFLESTFLAIWYFGWKHLSKRIHAATIWVVAIASNLSAVWIILANGFMQHPVGYVLQNNRAELKSFWEVITNPYAWGQFFHTISSSWMLAGFFVLAISAWQLYRKFETDFFRKSFRIAASFTLLMAILMVFTGHHQGRIVAKYQPLKLAAMEAQWESESSVPFNLFVIPNVKEQKNVEALPIPGLMSWLSHGSFSAEIKGLKSFPKEDWPPILISFISFRLMIGLGVLFVVMAGCAFFFRRKPEMPRWLARLLVWGLPFPYIALFLGWTLAEVGRQPWIVYGLMRTKDAVSPVPAENVLISLVAFVLIYSALGILDVYLLQKYARKGPDPAV